MLFRSNKGNAYVLGLQGSNIRGSIGGIVDKLKYDAEAISYTAGAVVEASIDSNWNRITMTYDKVNLKLYVNGILQSTSAFTETIDTNPFELMIGDDWNGSIDEVKIYNRALSVSEIRYQYSREGPISHWKFDEGSGTTAYDSEGNNNGTLTTMDNSDWVVGKYGTALDFDGSSDYVDVVGGEVNTSLQEITVSLWINLDADDTRYDVISRHGGSGGSDTRSGWSFYRDAADETFYWSAAEATDWHSLQSTTAITAAGGWYYLTGVFSDSGDFQKIYINGIEEAANNSATHTINYGSANNLKRSEERRVGKECRSRWSPYH